MSSSEREIRVAKQTRASARGAITKDFNLLQGIFDDPSSVDLIEVNSRLAKVVAQYEKVLSADNTLANKVSDDDLDDELSNVANYTETYLERLTKFRALAQKAESDAEIHRGVGQLNDSQLTDHSERGASVKLPKLEIAKFDGNPANWQEFWDSYEATIHNHADLSPVDKFKYLKSYLTKDAFRLADGYKLTSANYESVVECLHERFGNPEIAIFKHLEDLLAIKSASSDLSSLREVYDECEMHIRSLVGLGMEEETFGKVFTPIILSKLPKFTRIDLNRQNGLEAWTLANLRSLLKTEIQVREMSQHSFGANGNKNGSKGFRKTNGSGSKVWGTASNLVNAEAPRRGSKCPFCGDSHSPESCKQFPDHASRREAVKGKCFSCLQSNHMSRSCRSRKPCKHCSIKGHHPSLCRKKYPSDDGDPSDDQEQSKSEKVGLNAVAPVFTPQTPVISGGDKSKIAYMQTAVVQVSSPHNPSSTVKARLILDTASSRTYVTEALCKKLKLPRVTQNTVSVNRFRAKKWDTTKYDVVELKVGCLNGSAEQINALVIDHICNPVAVYPVDTSKYPQIASLSLAEPLVATPKLGEIDILVGGDWYFRFVTGLTQLDDDVTLLHSKLGYIVGGTAPDTCLIGTGFDASLVCNMFVASCDAAREPVTDPRDELERLWSLEDIGITDKVQCSDDDLALASFKDTVVFDEGRYHVAWPWKEDKPQLPTNFWLAFQRLKSLAKRLGSDQKLFDAYDKTIRDQQNMGVVEQINPKVQDGRVHYLPHHAVVRADHATTKIRVVYDASAKPNKESPSLNECLRRGPVLLSNIVGLILRFRLRKVALISDLEKAFLQIALLKSQRDVSRFLWIADRSKPITPDNLVVFRFCRVLFGVISSPFLLAAVIQHHLSRIPTETSKRIQQSVYVDNIICSVDSVDVASSFATESMQIFRDASMNLREWYSNDSTLLSRIPEKQRGKTVTPKVLGLVWSLDEDTLSLPKVKIQTVSATKRKVLQSVASFFDPCGLVSPVVLPGKVMLQDLWKGKYEWDDPVPTVLQAKWDMLGPDIEMASRHLVPRHLGYSGGDPVVLHCFCDASQDAYAAAVYLGISSSPRGVMESNLVFSKIRVAPISGMTIPKLELLAMVVGVKILSFVEKELQLPVKRKVLWSDSKCVLYWLASFTANEFNSNKSRFVLNRLKSIKDQSDGVEFRFVPSSDNPADLASRGCKYSTLVDNHAWWHGPNWLANETQWPETKIFPSECAAIEVVPTLIQAAGTVQPMIQFERFSSLAKLARVTAWIIRFCSRCRKRGASGPLTVGEIRKARIYLIRSVQTMWLGNSNYKVRKLKRSLDVVEGSDGLYRCGGRLKYAVLPEKTKNPIILPPDQWFTRLVIEEVHKVNCHCGVSQTLCELRMTFWVPKGRSQVKQVLGKCTVCRKAAGRSYQPPKEPPLPSFRVMPQAVFASTGLDYLGPLHISDLSGARKVWICLFTCAVVRAVHLEVVPDMSASQFLLALRRFCALYGKPDRIISDNASQLHASNREIIKLLQKDPVQEFSTNAGIEWKFIPELSPWMGGFYERLVGVVKSSLRKSLQNRLLTLVELQTVVAEVSAIANNRPLTYVCEDGTEGPLTPAHFLLKRGRPSFPLSETTSDDFLSGAEVSQQGVLMSWKRTNSVLNEYWDRFQREYLLGLRERSRHNRVGLGPEVTVDSVVLIKDNVPRGQWKLGRVLSLNLSSDGNVRSAVVLTGSGKKLVRPIKLLCPVEVTPSNPKDQTNSPQSPQSTPPSLPPSRRAPRKAALNAKARIRELAQESDSE
jgi:hypothetical protein